MTATAPSAEPVEVAEQLLAAASDGGVERLWFTSGSDLTSLQEAEARRRAHSRGTPSIVTSPHEHVGLCAAMGEAMVRRQPSMTAVHADLGVLHQGGALHNAFRGNYPVLLLGGYPATTPERRTASVYWKQQRWDPGGAVRQYVKWEHRLASHDDPALVVARALQVAMSPPRGPAYLAVPDEVGRAPAGPADSVAGLADVQLPGGDHDQLELIATRLLRAEQPLVVTDRLGDDPAVVATFDALVEEFGLAVTSTRHRMNLRDDHPCRWHGSTLAEADAVLAVEHPVPWIPVREQPSTATWIGVVGTDPLQGEIPVYEFPASLRLQVDPARFLMRLHETMRRLARPADRERARERVAAWQARIQPPRPPRRSGQPTPGDVAAGLGEVIGAEDQVCWEIVDLAALPRSRPGTLFEKGGSSLGWAVGAAVGARLGSADRPTVAVTGDGGYLMGSPASTLWLQHQLDAPVLTVVVNNQGHRTGTQAVAEDYPHGYAVAEDRYPGGVFDPSPDHAAHARSQGGFGAQVTDAAELVDGLRRARDAVELERVPAVVDVRVKPHRPPRRTQDSAAPQQRRPADSWSDPPGDARHHGSEA